MAAVVVTVKLSDPIRYLVRVGRMEQNRDNGHIKDFLKCFEPGPHPRNQGARVC